MSAEDGLFALLVKDGGLLRPGPRARALLRGTLDLIFPPRAMDGGTVMAAGLSAEAWSRIQFLDGPVCDGCGAPFEFDIGSRCAACLAQPRAFDAARAACLYDETSREPILKLKHGDRTDLAPLFARWLSRAAQPLIEEADAIAPVPLHPSRLLSRRYNQAAEIARPLSRMTGVPYLPDALVRRRATDTQGGKSGVCRKRNVAGAFEVPGRRAWRVAGKRVLLIDDVMTTGATAEGCARALKAAGAVRVDVAAVARVKEMSRLTI
ncbi:ComF family protein [Phenylobacterium sp.]|uniref:ComF family protein n=1 Tax=Phenylobacterium sp. TaxID=1871053 RepID=UPI001218A800|nr:ComF family protein [Phenylobacterium sp.]THD60947.1 MAG: ComF family protein [Phenylobacterium sp.]